MLDGVDSFDRGQALVVVSELQLAKNACEHLDPHLDIVQTRAYEQQAAIVGSDITQLEAVFVDHDAAIVVGQIEAVYPLHLKQNRPSLGSAGSGRLL